MTRQTIEEDDVENSNATGQIRIREGAAAWRQVEGETILLDLDSSRYLGVNSSGSLLWPMLVDGTHRDAMMDCLVREYGISRDEAESGVDDFLAACRAHNLLAS